MHGTSSQQLLKDRRFIQIPMGQYKVKPTPKILNPKPETLNPKPREALRGGIPGVVLGVVIGAILWASFAKVDKFLEF